MEVKVKVSKCWDDTERHEFSVDGKTCEYIGCSKSSLQRWVERYFETGSVKNKEYKRRNSRIKETHLEFIKKTIKDKPAITLHRLQNAL